MAFAAAAPLPLIIADARAYATAHGTAGHYHPALAERLCQLRGGADGMDYIRVIKCPSAG